MSETNLIKEKFYINLTFKYTPILFIFDQLTRIIILFTYLYYDFSAWYFLLIQFIILVITGVISDKIKTKVLSKYKKNVNPIYSNLNSFIEIIDDIPIKLMGYQVFLGYAFSFWFFYHIFDNHLWYHYIFIVLLAIFGSVFFVSALAITPVPRTSKGAQEVQIKIRKTVLENGNEKFVFEDATNRYPIFFTQGILFEPDPIEFDTVDLNDTKIAKLESELKNINYKAEAWLLESVFLGGLAFSGFLTVASANFLGVETETFKLFISHILNYIQSCNIENISSLYVNSSDYFTRNDLYIITMLLCLLSSVFFLLILTLRLRLNSLSLNLDHIMRILIIFNAKEEEIYNNNEDLENRPNQVARFDKIQRKIEIALNDGEKLLTKIRPVFMMMNIYRTIALLLFYLVLILSGFYFMPVIAAAISGLAIFTFLFRKIETYINIEEIKRRVKRH